MIQPFEPLPVPTDPAFLFQSDDGTLFVRGGHYNTQNVEQNHVSFDMRDSRNRKVGARLTTYREDHLPRTSTHSLLLPQQLGTGWFVLRFHATRDGKDYGAGQPAAYFQSATERDVAIEKYLSAARKRAAKVAA